ncbi:MAG: adenylyl-sulfate kinase [Anaerolineae bacterium]
MEVCLTRDTKGIYAKAMAGQATTVPGLQEPFDLPDRQEVVVETDRQSPHECAQQILSRLRELCLLN